MRALILSLVAAPATASSVVAVSSSAAATNANDATLNQANPIRKVVTMLQNMQKKVEAEGEKEKELFDKFMCYCKNAGGELSKSISDAGVKIPDLGANIDEAIASKAQYEEDLKKHQVDRQAAKEAIADATAVREKEAASFNAEATELKTNIGAFGKAIQAVESAKSGAFLQSDAANVLKNLALNDEKMLDADRSELTSFLSGETEDVGSILGIMKQMKDTMQATLDDATGEENGAKATFDKLVAAKTKEVDALTKAIEEKTVRVGELGIQIVQMKEDLSDTEEALYEDKKFLEGLDKNCATKEKEWAIIVKNRGEELLALADTIKILNDDDALEMFKKTLPGSSAAFIQTTTKNMRAKAVAVLQKAREMKKDDRQRIDFVLLALKGKAGGFEKVIKMIDDMVALLQQEQLDDEHKKEYCEMQFDFTEDKKKELERKVSNLETAIENAKEGIAQLKVDIEALDDGITALDKQVAEATEQRKEENDDFKTLVASDSQAKEILKFAKNRLNKFYNPKLYKPEGASFMQLSTHKNDADPGPPPEAPGAYKKKGEEGNGVIGMIDLLIKELDTEITEAQTEEKLAQEEYEELMADSAQKRALDSKTLTEKAGVKAETEATLAAKETEKKDTIKELFATEEYLGNLHGECDWLIKYFDMRKEARTGEIDAMKKAKAVLSGADFSLMQTKARNLLHRA